MSSSVMEITRETLASALEEVDAFVENGCQVTIIREWQEKEQRYCYFLRVDTMPERAK